MKDDRFLSRKLLFGLCFAIFFTVTLTIASAESEPSIEWQKCLGGSDGDKAYSAQQTSDGGYIIAGYSAGSIIFDEFAGYQVEYDYWVVKLNTNGDIQWQKRLGGSNRDDKAYSAQQTSDGGYIIAGYSYSNDGDVTGNHGSSDYWVVKLDTGGDIVWQKCLGGSGYDYAYSIQQTSDSGYIIAGYSGSNDGDVTGNHGNGDYWVVKLNTGGDIQWQKCLGGSDGDEAYSAQQTSDGGYIIAGYSYSNDGDVTGNHGTDYWVVKLDTGGDIVWQKCLGGSGYDYAYSIQQTSDSGYIIAGYSGSNDGDVTGNHGNGDYWVVKLDTDGGIVWQKCLGGSSPDSARSIHQTSDGGYTIAGFSYSNNGDVTGNHGSSDYWVVKLNTGGDIQWQKCLGGSNRDEACSAQQTSDGGYIIAGYSGSNDGDVTENHGEVDYWIVELEPDENEDETDFSILDINPVQVIYGCDIDEDEIVDLVAGKPIAVDVGTYLHVDRLEDLDLDQSIGFELLIDGQTCGREEKTIRELEEHRQTNIIFYPNQALEAGVHTIEAKITPDIDDWDKDNNMLSETVEVKDTNDLYLVYFPIDETELGYFNLNPSSYGPIDMEEYASTVEDSGRFINATYPISKLTNTLMECKYYGSDLPSVSYDWINLGGVVSDMLYIWEAGEFFTLTFADRSVGIVPDGYFEYHHIVNNPVGLYLWPINAGLVEVGYPTTTAHEIGHSYGLRLPIIGPGEEYNLKNPPYANGIWVSEKMPYTGELCFMNYAPMKYSLSRWVCDEDYEDLFKSFSTSYTPTTSLPLTNVILCSGIVYKNDTIDLMPTYFVENGITDKVPSGDYSLKILDMNKDVLDETDFDVQFFVTSDSVGTIETDVSGFAFVANYPEEASTILIQHEDKTLVEFNPHSKLLHDAIDSIPDEGFVKNPEQSRKALHAKINAFEKMLEEGSFEEAQVKLEDDIEDKVEKWVVDDYQKDNPLKLSKEEVLHLINEEEDRLKIISGQ